jgi:hypothetical protein
MEQSEGVSVVGIVEVSSVFEWNSLKELVLLTLWKSVVFLNGTV